MFLNHIRIKGIEIIGQNTKIPRALNLSTNSHQDINWSSKYNNLVIIIIKEELQYSKHPKLNPNLIL